jgi:Spy/CpxP family protein refolding chaperone
MVARSSKMLPMSFCVWGLILLTAFAQSPRGALEGVKKQIEATDEEWKVIGPKLQKLIAARQVLAADARGSEVGFGAFGGGGFGALPPAERPGSSPTAGRPGGSFEGPGATFGGFGGFGPPGGGAGRGGPQVGQILPQFLQDFLKLTAEQKKELADLQKDVDSKFDKVLTDEQKKQLKQMRDGAARGGLGSFPSDPRKSAPKDPAKKSPAGGSPSAEPAAADKQGAGAKEPGRTEPRPKDPSRPGGFGGGGGAFGAGGGGGGGVFGFGSAASSSAIGQARADLRSTMADPKRSASEVEAKLAAVRKARAKARTDLEAAQADLVQLLTAQQQAVLVGLGYLD